MKKLSYLFLLGALYSAALQLDAQEKPKAEERVNAPTPVKVQIVFAEYDGEKKVSSMPYVFTLISEKGHLYSTSIRTGIRVPVEFGASDQKITYLDIGTNIDCGLRPYDDGRFNVTLTFDRSEFYPNKSADGERLVVSPGGQPLVRQFRTSETLLLKDGQTSENLLSTDPLNGRTLRVSVTINVLK
jgi:hypothetical protein